MTHIYVSSAIYLDINGSIFGWQLTRTLEVA